MLLLLAITALLVVPWQIRNYRIVHSPVLSTISSYNLLFYNAASLAADEQGVGLAQMQREMLKRVQAKMDAQRVSDEASRLKLYNEWGSKIILAHPYRYTYVHLKDDLNSFLPNATEFLELLGVTKGGKGTLSVLNQYGFRAAIRHYFGKQVWLLWILSPLVALLGVTYLGSLVGLVVLARRRIWFPLALLLLPVAYLLLIPGAPSCPRFRMPAMPHICLLAGTGLTNVWQWASDKLHWTRSY